MSSAPLRFEKEVPVPVGARDLEAWHFAPGAFQRLVPPWDKVRVIEEPDAIHDGARAVLQLKAGPVATTWVAEHRDCHPGEGFTDVQVKGPFAQWEHRHEFKDLGEGKSLLRDAIAYRLPMGMLGNVAAGWWVKRKLERTFRYRHAVTQMDLERRAEEPSASAPMTILITGGTGMIGRALETYLRMRGHEVRRVTRHPKRDSDVRWDPQKGEMDLAPQARVDAAVHLAGENVAGGRWTAARKKRILESRRRGTALLCEKLAALERPPKALVSASGANYYAQGTDDAQTEESPKGAGFLSEVCEVWEAGTQIAEAAGIRVTRLRIGVVLSPSGGALAKMLPAFRFGVAGRLGSGKQRFTWIGLPDLVDVMSRALVDERYEGVINAVAPEVVTNAAFTQTLAGVLRRPAFIPVPAKALHLALGEEMAEETLLADLHLAPSRLQRLNYPFRFPQLDGALRFLLGRE